MHHGRKPRSDRFQNSPQAELFDWSQRAANVWDGSNNALRREILDSVCLNRTLSDVSLVTQKRKPFDFLAERQDFENNRGGRI
jgi:hypothetical protein